MKRCSVCGASNKDINNFCSSCGRKLESAAGAAPASQQSSVWSTPASQQGSVWSAPASQQSSAWSSSASQSAASGYQITFIRPSSFQFCGNLFHIKVDDCVKYDLRNGDELTIELSPGNHTISISVFGVPRRKTFSFDANRDMTFTCKPARSQLLTMWTAPIKVTDSNGVGY